MEVLDQLDAAAILKSNIDDRDVGVFGVSNLLCLGNTAGFATDGEIVLRRKQADEPLTHERMIIDDQYFGSHAEKVLGRDRFVARLKSCSRERCPQDYRRVLWAANLSQK